MAKYSVIKTFAGSVAFSTLFAALIFYLFLSASKWRCKASLKYNLVEINLNFSGKDFPKIDKVITAKVPYFSLLTGFGFTIIKKF